MQALGIITEYNPFHNGHFYHINKAKKLTGYNHIIAVMSGNYVQRGEPAAFDKQARTEMALRCGVDIVLELPVYFSCASAEQFARGAVSILNASGIVAALCFGSESGDIGDISQIAGFLADEPDIYTNALKKNLDLGLSFPAARACAMADVGGDSGGILSQPNNILGIEYLKALRQINSGIVPFTIKRKSAHYHSKEIAAVSSATAIRNALADDISSVRQAMPQYCYEILERETSRGRAPVQYDSLSPILHYIIKTSKVDYLKNIRYITEGLENRIIRASGQHYRISDIVASIKTKRYTYTALQRSLLHIILGITGEDADDCAYPRYIRVLGFRRESQGLLSELTQKAALPVVLNLKHAEKILDDKAMRMLETEIRATDIYYLATPEKDGKKNTPVIKQEYHIPLVIV